MKAEVPNRNAPRMTGAARGAGAGSDELRAVVRRRWKLAAWAFCMPFGVAVGLAMFLPALYQARAVVLVQPIAEPGAVADDLSVRIEQLTRENLAGPRLVALIERHHIYPRLTVVTDDAASALRGDVDIETQHVDQANGRVSAAIAVSVRGRDPEKIAALANDLAAFYVEAERLQHDDEVKAAAAELAQVKVELDAEEARIKDFDDKNLGELPEQVQLHMATIATLNAQLEAVRATHARAVEHAGAMSARASAPPPITELATAPVAELTPAELELTKAEADLRDLHSRYTDEHPEVIRATREVALLRSRVAASRQRAHWSPTEPASHAPASTNPTSPVPRWRGDTEVKRLETEELDLENKIAGAEDAALNAPRRAHERAALLPEVEAARESYARQLKRYQELSLPGAAAGRNPFHVFEEAVPGHAQVAPKRTRLAILGFIFAIFFAGAAVWLGEQSDRTFHSARELRAFTGLLVLGSIPRLVATREQIAARRRAYLLGAAGLTSVVAVFAATCCWAAGNEALVRMFFRR